MDDIFTQCREGNAVAVRLWLDNTENDLNQGWDIFYWFLCVFVDPMLYSTCNNCHALPGERVLEMFHFLFPVCPAFLNNAGSCQILISSPFIPVSHHLCKSHFHYNGAWSSQLCSARPERLFLKSPVRLWPAIEPVSSWLCLFKMFVQNVSTVVEKRDTGQEAAMLAVSNVCSSIKNAIKVVCLIVFLNL